MIHHIYPTNDSQEHSLEAVSCSCIPIVKFDCGDLLIIHNAFDNRKISDEIEKIL